MDYRKLMESFHKSKTIKECFHHNKSECNGKIKQSHSIQRNGRLSIIEGDVNGNQSIYTLTSHIPSEKHLFEELKPIGKKEASTFFGFCDFHDTTLFSPIENFPFDQSEKHQFLHSYRSYAHSYHRKKEDQKVYNDPNSDFTKSIPPSILEEMKMGIEMGINDSTLRKEQLDSYIENQEYGALEYFVYEKAGLYPIAVSSQLSPPVTYRNKPMNNHLDPNVPYSQPIITLLPDKDTTFVILAAFPDDENSITLLDELDDLPILKLEKAITSLIIANCENTFFSPAFWNSLSKFEKRLLLDEFEMHIPANLEYNNKFFHSKFNFFDNRFEQARLTKK